MEGFTPSHPLPGSASLRPPATHRRPDVFARAASGEGGTPRRGELSSPGAAARGAGQCLGKLRGELPSASPMLSSPAPWARSAFVITHCVARCGAQACHRQVSSAKHTLAVHVPYPRSGSCASMNEGHLFCAPTIRPLSQIHARAAFTVRRLSCVPQGACSAVHEELTVSGS